MYVCGFIILIHIAHPVNSLVRTSAMDLIHDNCFPDVHTVKSVISHLDTWYDFGDFGHSEVVSLLF